MSLLIYDTSNVVQCKWAIFNFAILVLYILYNNDMLQYIMHTLYRLEKTKTAFKQYWLIDLKLY